MARKHAMLAPSACARWSVCTAAPTMEADLPDISTPYSLEGTHAHSLAELLVTKHFTRMRKSTFDKRLAELQEGEYYTPAMLEHCTAYRDLVTEFYLELKGETEPFVDIEKRVHFDEYVPEGFGSCDCILIGDDTLHVIDFKYGAGVPVSAQDNPQLMLYALGAMLEYELVYDFEHIKMTIHQPRLDSISTAEITADELRAWAEALRPIAQEAYEGPGTFAPGEDTCRFCKARATCRARAEANLELARYEFAQPATLDHDEIAEILGRVAELKSWAKDVEDYALEEARDHGVEFPGWKLVEGRSNRRYADQDAVRQRLIDAGWDIAAITETSLLGITAMERAIGKKVFDTELEDLIIKPAGRPTLVPVSDRRPALNSTQSAVEDFSEEN